MHFISSAAEERAMLDALGLESAEELFRDVPESVRVGLDLPDGEDELTVRRGVGAILRESEPFEARPHFLGAGAYHHFIPSAVKAILQRGEFLTSYTPYQPEITQGFLQAMFEYQTYVCRLTEMDVANISMYDGPTAVAEAALMAARASRKSEFILPAHLDPDKRSVVENYTRGAGMRVLEAPFDEETGRLDVAALEALVGDDTAGVYLENPNVFGCFETAAGEVRDVLDRKARRALFVVGVNPMSLGLVRGPGAYGADVVVGEGQPLGQPVSFGGPHLGLFAARKDLLRRMPGRIVGQTVDANGERAYTLTLQTREQHIRRERATSNICTNEGMNALAATTYLAVMGERGFKDVSRANAARARDLARRIDGVPGFAAPAFPGAHFNEFVVRSEAPVPEVEAAIQAAGLRGGLDLAPWFPDMGHAALYCVTEAHPEWALDALVGALEEVGA